MPLPRQNRCVHAVWERPRGVMGEHVDVRGRHSPREGEETESRGRLQPLGDKVQGQVGPDEHAGAAQDLSNPSPLHMKLCRPCARPEPSANDAQTTKR
eukprot:scaffold68741_cov44-Prasinocladus_malaysianus.AAC.1